MAWIESHTVLLRHRKLIELSKSLRIRKSHALGHLHALWHAALEQAEDGDLSQWSDEFIAEMSDFPGSAPQYVRLLQQHGFLDAKLLHDWLDYAGQYLRRKYHESKREKLVEIWAKHGKAYGQVPQGTRQEPERNPTLPNLPNQQKKKHKEHRLLFELLFKQYPDHQGKEKAWERFNCQVKTKADWFAIRTALTNYKKRLSARPWLTPQAAPVWFNRNSKIPGKGWPNFVEEYNEPAETVKLESKNKLKADFWGKHGTN